MVSFWLGKPQDGAEVVIKPKGFFGQLFHYGIVLPVKFTFSLLTYPFRSFLSSKKNSEKVVEESALTLDKVRDYLSDEKKISGPEAHKLITSAIEKRPDKEALASALTVDGSNMLPITMYGRHVHKEAAYQAHQVGRGRKGIDVHPYGKTGSGADAIVTYRNIKDGELYVLLGRKQVKFGDPSAGLVDEWSLPGGYMKPFALEGAQGSVAIDEEARDVVEEAILRGEGKFTAGDFKKTSKDGKISYDVNLDAAIKRELKEETGIDKFLDLQQIGTRSEYGVTNDPRLHTIVADYLADLGRHNSHPAVNAASDLQDLTWVKVSDIAVDPSVAKQPFGSKQSRYSFNGIRIRDDHGDAMSEAVKVKREHDFKEAFEGMSVDFITSRLAQSGIKDFSKRPTTELGKEASAFYDGLIMVYTEVTRQMQQAQMEMVKAYSKEQEALSATLANEHADGQTVVDKSAERGTSTA